MSTSRSWQADGINQNPPLVLDMSIHYGYPSAASGALVAPPPTSAVAPWSFDFLQQDGPPNLPPHIDSVGLA